MSKFLDLIKSTIVEVKDDGDYVICPCHDRNRRLSLNHSGLNVPEMIYMHIEDNVSFGKCDRCGTIYYRAEGIAAEIDEYRKECVSSYLIERIGRNTKDLYNLRKRDATHKAFKSIENSVELAGNRDSIFLVKIGKEKARERDYASIIDYATNIVVKQLK